MCGLQSDAKRVKYSIEHDFSNKGGKDMCIIRLYRITEELITTHTLDYTDDLFKFEHPER